MDYQTIGVGIAVIVALWRMIRDLKQDINSLKRDLRQDMAEIRQALTLNQESLASVRERVAKLESTRVPSPTS